MANLPAIENPMPGEYEYVFDIVIGYIRSPYWKAPIVSFIDEHCVIFDDDEENKLEYTSIHN